MGARRLRVHAPGGAQQPSGPPIVRRKRASKPKVNTGCLTCKIRRVKCDEARPSCVKCTSTGRKCDGYEKAVPPVKSRAAESLRGLAVARQEFLESFYHRDAASHYNVISSTQNHITLPFQTNPNPILRPLVADIPGTETERRFFHGFRMHPGVARDGLTIHVHNFSPFWRRLVPQLSHQDPAVKHALVALGAQYWLFEHNQEKCDWGDLPRDNQSCTSQDRSCMTPIEGQNSRAAIETFAVQQYNRSMSRLARLVADASVPSSPSSSTGSTASTTSDYENTQRLALVCCLVFICIETLRGNGDAALTHLTNGLRILAEALPDEAIAFLAEEGDDEIWDDEDRMSKDEELSGETETDMREIVRIFVRLENSAACLSKDFTPHAQLKLLKLVRQRHERRRERLALLPPPEPPSLALIPTPQPPEPEFLTLRDAHVTFAFMLRFLVARMHEVQPHYADPAFWSTPSEQAAQAHILARMDRLDQRLRRFRQRHLKRSRGHAETMSVWIDWMHFNTARAVAEVMTGCGVEDGRLVPLTRVSAMVEGLLRECVAVARMLQDAMRAPGAGDEAAQRATRPAPRFTYDMSLIGPMYNVAVTTADLALRREALRILRGNTTREAFWEGPKIQAMIEGMSKVADEGTWPDAYIPGSMGSYGAVTKIMGSLERMHVDAEEE